MAVVSFSKCALELWEGALQGVELEFGLRSLGVCEARTWNEFAVLIESQVSGSYPIDMSKDIKMMIIITSCIVCLLCASTVLVF